MGLTFAMWVIAVTVCLAATAAVLNFFAALHGPLALRVMCGMRAVIAGLYVPAYVWLLWNPTKRAVWSETVAGLSLIAWIVVWIMPAVLALRMEQRAAAVAEKLRG